MCLAVAVEIDASWVDDFFLVSLLVKDLYSPTISWDEAGGNGRSPIPCKR
jgi:hypothetical protein